MAGDGHGKQAVLCKLCILFYVVCKVVWFSCHNFFKIQSLIFYFSNFRGTLEADDVIGKE